MKFIIYEGWSDRFDCDSRYYEKELTSQAMGLVDLYNTLNEIHKIKPFKNFKFKKVQDLKKIFDECDEIALTFKAEENKAYHTVISIIKSKNKTQ